MHLFDQVFSATKKKPFYKPPTPFNSEESSDLSDAMLRTDTCWKKIILSIGKIYNLVSLMKIKKSFNWSLPSNNEVIQIHLKAALL